MTQQDDITQRVLTDDELQALWDEACKDSPQAPGWNRHIRYGRAIESALPSKLRAPVADEPPGGTRWPVLRAMARNYTAGKHTWDALDAEACEQAAEEIRHLRAALASAPVAGEAVTNEMIQAGAKAAREYFERTGGNDPAVIYRAMRAAAPTAPQASAEYARDTALSNLLWAASERDKGNRIRQFDQFMDEARAAISSNAAKQGSRDE